MRRPMALSRLRRSNAMSLLKIIVMIASIAAGVLATIFFGFPLIEDLIRGVDPALRYQPKVEKNFELQAGKDGMGTFDVQELIIQELKIKNDPYIDGDRIIFTTRTDGSNAGSVDSVVIYNTKTNELDPLPNVKIKYDNLLNPVISGNYAAWVDSLNDGGGQIIGYDLTKNQQFLIKEYAYAIPKISIAGDLITFMQWAGESLQRLYVYNINTREAVTVKLLESEVGNSAADISTSDMVWSEYQKNDSGVTGSLKRIVFENGNSRYENYDFGMDVFEPKTNGKDIAFSTAYNISSGSLMLSAGGGDPMKIADNVLNYDIGDGFVVYTKDEMVFICFTNQQKIEETRPPISKNLLMGANGNGFVFYDVTDSELVLDVVMYAYVE